MYTDDSTNENPEEIVREVRFGRVVFYSQVKNMAHLGSFEICWRCLPGWPIQ